MSETTKFLRSGNMPLQRSKLNFKRPPPGSARSTHPSYQSATGDRGPGKASAQHMGQHQPQPQPSHHLISLQNQKNQKQMRQTATIGSVGESLSQFIANQSRSNSAAAHSHRTSQEEETNSLKEKESSSERKVVVQERDGGKLLMTTKPTTTLDSSQHLLQVAEENQIPETNAFTNTDGEKHQNSQSSLERVQKYLRKGDGQRRKKSSVKNATSSTLNNMNRTSAKPFTKSSHYQREKSSISARTTTNVRRRADAVSSDHPAATKDQVGVNSTTISKQVRFDIKQGLRTMIRDSSFDAKKVRDETILKRRQKEGKLSSCSPQEFSSMERDQTNDPHEFLNHVDDPSQIAGEDTTMINANDLSLIQQRQQLQEGFTSNNVRLVRQNNVVGNSSQSQATSPAQKLKKRRAHEKASPAFGGSAIYPSSNRLQPHSSVLLQNHQQPQPQPQSSSRSKLNQKSRQSDLRQSTSGVLNGKNGGENLWTAGLVVNPKQSQNGNTNSQTSVGSLAYKMALRYKKESLMSQIRKGEIEINPTLSNQLTLSGQRLLDPAATEEEDQEKLTSLNIMREQQSEQGYMNNNDGEFYHQTEEGGMMMRQQDTPKSCRNLPPKPSEKPNLNHDNILAQYPNRHSYNHNNINHPQHIPASTQKYKNAKSHMATATLSSNRADSRKAGSICRLRSQSPAISQTRRQQKLAGLGCHMEDHSGSHPLSKMNLTSVRGSAVNYTAGGPILMSSDYNAGAAQYQDENEDSPVQTQADSIQEEPFSDQQREPLHLNGKLAANRTIQVGQIVRVSSSNNRNQQAQTELSQRDNNHDGARMVVGGFTTSKANNNPALRHQPKQMDQLPPSSSIVPISMPLTANNGSEIACHPSQYEKTVDTFSPPSFAGTLGPFTPQDECGSSAAAPYIVGYSRSQLGQQPHQVVVQSSEGTTLMSDLGHYQQYQRFQQTVPDDQKHVSSQKAHPLSYLNEEIADQQTQPYPSYAAVDTGNYQMTAISNSNRKQMGKSPKMTQKETVFVPKPASHLLEPIWNALKMTEEQFLDEVSWIRPNVLEVSKDVMQKEIDLVQKDLSEGEMGCQGTKQVIQTRLSLLRSHLKNTVLDHFLPHIQEILQIKDRIAFRRMTLMKEIRNPMKRQILSDICSRLTQKAILKTLFVQAQFKKQSIALFNAYYDLLIHRQIISSSFEELKHFKEKRFEKHAYLDYATTRLNELRQLQTFDCWKRLKGVQDLESAKQGQSFKILSQRHMFRIVTAWRMQVLESRIDRANDMLVQQFRKLKRRDQLIVRWAHMNFQEKKLRNEAIKQLNKQQETLTILVNGKPQEPIQLDSLSDTERSGTQSTSIRKEIRDLVDQNDSQIARYAQKECFEESLTRIESVFYEKIQSLLLEKEHYKTLISVLQTRLVNMSELETRIPLVFDQQIPNPSVWQLKPSQALISNKEQIYCLYPELQTEHTPLKGQVKNTATVYNFDAPQEAPTIFQSDNASANLTNVLKPPLQKVMLEHQEALLTVSNPGSARENVDPNGISSSYGPGEVPQQTSQIPSKNKNLQQSKFQGEIALQMKYNVHQALLAQQNFFGNSVQYEQLHNQQEQYTANTLTNASAQNLATFENQQNGTSVKDLNGYSVETINEFPVQVAQTEVIPFKMSIKRCVYRNNTVEGVENNEAQEIRKVPNQLFMKLQQKFAEANQIKEMKLNFMEAEEEQIVPLQIKLKAHLRGLIQILKDQWFAHNLSEEVLRAKALSFYLRQEGHLPANQELIQSLSLTNYVQIAQQTGTRFETLNEIKSRFRMMLLWRQNLTQNLIISDFQSIKTLSIAKIAMRQWFNQMQRLKAKAESHCEMAKMKSFYSLFKKWAIANRKIIYETEKEVRSFKLAFVVKYWRKFTNLRTAFRKQQRKAIEYYCRGLQTKALVSLYANGDSSDQVRQFRRKQTFLKFFKRKWLKKTRTRQLLRNIFEKMIEREEAAPLNRHQRRQKMLQKAYKRWQKRVSEKLKLIKTYVALNHYRNSLLRKHMRELKKAPRHSTASQILLDLFLERNLRPSFDKIVFETLGKQEQLLQHHQAKRAINLTSLVFKSWHASTVQSKIAKMFLQKRYLAALRTHVYQERFCRPQAFYRKSLVLGTFRALKLYAQNRFKKDRLYLHFRAFQQKKILDRKQQCLDALQDNIFVEKRKKMVQGTVDDFRMHTLQERCFKTWKAYNLYKHKKRLLNGVAIDFHEDKIARAIEVGRTRVRLNHKKGVLLNLNQELLLKVIAEWRQVTQVFSRNNYKIKQAIQRKDLSILAKIFTSWASLTRYAVSNDLQQSHLENGAIASNINKTPLSTTYFMTPSVIGTEVQGQYQQQCSHQEAQIQERQHQREDQIRLGRVNEIMSRYRKEMKQEMADRSRISPQSNKHDLGRPIQISSRPSQNVQHLNSQQEVLTSANNRDLIVDYDQNNASLGNQQVFKNHKRHDTLSFVNTDEQDNHQPIHIVENLQGKSQNSNYRQPFGQKRPISQETLTSFANTESNDKFSIGQMQQNNFNGAPQHQPETSGSTLNNRASLNQVSLGQNPSQGAGVQPGFGNLFGRHKSVPSSQGGFIAHNSSISTNPAISSSNNFNQRQEIQSGSTNFVATSPDRTKQSRFTPGMYENTTERGAATTIHQDDEGVEEQNSQEIRHPDDDDDHNQIDANQFTLQEVQLPLVPGQQNDYQMELQIQHPILQNNHEEVDDYNGSTAVLKHANHNQIQFQNQNSRQQLSSQQVFNNYNGEINRDYATFSQDFVQLQQLQQAKGIAQTNGSAFVQNQDQFSSDRGLNQQIYTIPSAYQNLQLIPQTVESPSSDSNQKPLKPLQNDDNRLDDELSIVTEDRIGGGSLDNDNEQMQEQLCLEKGDFSLQNDNNLAQFPGTTLSYQTGGSNKLHQELESILRMNEEVKGDQEKRDELIQRMGAYYDSSKVSMANQEKKQGDLFVVDQGKENMIEENGQYDCDTVVTEDKSQVSSEIIIA